MKRPTKLDLGRLFQRLGVVQVDMAANGALIPNEIATADESDSHAEQFGLPPIHPSFIEAHAAKGHEDVDTQRRRSHLEHHAFFTEVLDSASRERGSELT